MFISSLVSCVRFDEGPGYNMHSVSKGEDEMKRDGGLRFNIIFSYLLLFGLCVLVRTTAIQT